MEGVGERKGIKLYRRSTALIKRDAANRGNWFRLTHFTTRDRSVSVWLLRSAAAHLLFPVLHPLQGPKFGGRLTAQALFNHV